MKRLRVFIAMVCAVMAALSVASCASEDIAGGEENSCVGISVQKEGLPARGEMTRATVSGLDVSFADGDAVGIYVLDASGKVVDANVKCTLSGGKWTPQTPLLYAKSLTYYAYSPYKENVSGGVAVGDIIASPSFESVMGGVVSAWTPLADQSTLTNFLTSDLCAAEGVISADAKTVEFSLKHRMGLWYADINYDPGFSGNVPFVNNLKGYFLMKPDTDTQILDITYNIPGGKYQEKSMFRYDLVPVDLGLPSGLKWAAANIGAKNPEDAGLYFAWGETTGYTAEQVKADERVFDDATYQAGPAASISADLTLEQDAAHINLGGNWRMPTKAEIQELIDNCNSTWTTDYNGTGVAGRLFTSNINGNSIFLPASGYCNGSSVYGVGSYGFYWSASWYSSGYAWNLYFYSGNVYVYGSSRYYGFSVRGVCE